MTVRIILIVCFMLTAPSVYSFGLDDLEREASGALKEVADKVEEVSDKVKAVKEIVNPSPTQETSVSVKPQRKSNRTINEETAGVGGMSISVEKFPPVSVQKFPLCLGYLHCF
jgi:hypothetical protein